MELTSAQILLIKKEIKKKGINNDALAEDILDHFCCIVEERLEQNSDFRTAYNEAVKQFGSLKQLQAKTTESIESVKMLPRFIRALDHLSTVAYLFLGLSFSIVPIYLTFSYRDISFLAMFSPFVAMGFYLCFKRIDYRKLQIIPFQKKIFPGSLIP